MKRYIALLLVLYVLFGLSQLAFTQEAKLLHVIDNWPGGYVRNVRFSPDASLLAVGRRSAPFDLRIVDVETGLLIHQIPGHSSELYNVNWSPDGKYIVVGEKNNTVTLWTKAVNAEVKYEFLNDTWVRNVNFSPDGKLLAFGSYNHGRLQVMDTETGVVEEFSDPNGHTGQIFNLAWSPDGKYLATGSFDQTIKIWDVSKKQVIQTLTGHNRRLTYVQFSPDGENLYSYSDASTSVAPQVIKWAKDETGAWVKVAEREVILVPVTASGSQNHVLNVSPDGEKLVVVIQPEGSPEVEIWAASDLTTIDTLIPTSLNRIRDINWSPCGQFIAAGGQNGITVWNAADNVIVAEILDQTGQVYGVDWTDDGKYLGGGCNANIIHIWDTETYEPVYEYIATQTVLTFDFSPTGDQFAAGTSSEQLLRLFDFSSGWVIDQTLTGHNGAGVDYVQFSSDGKRLYSYSGVTGIIMWEKDADDNWVKVKERAADAPSGNHVFYLSPCETKLAVGNNTGTGLIEVWDTNADWTDDSTVLGTLAASSLTRIRDIDWSPDGSYIVAGGDTGVTIWNADDFSVDLEISGTGLVYAVDWSPDGEFIGGGCNEDYIYVWDAVTGDIQFQQRAGSTVLTFDWSEDGKYFATGTSGEETLRIYQWLQ